MTKANNMSSAPRAYLRNSTKMVLNTAIKKRVTIGAVLSMNETNIIPKRSTKQYHNRHTSFSYPGHATTSVAISIHSVCVHLAARVLVAEELVWKHWDRIVLVPHASELGTQLPKSATSETDDDSHETLTVTRQRTTTK